MDNKEQMQAKRNRAYDLRLSGKTYRQIGMEMGVSHVTAQNWVKDYLAEVTLPLVDEVRKQEVDRMQRILDRLEARADEGDDKALALQLKVSERLCKMLGADAPQQVQVEKTEVTQVDVAIRELMSDMEARNRARLADAASRRAGVLSDDTSDTDTDSLDGVLDSDIESIVRDM